MVYVIHSISGIVPEETKNNFRGPILEIIRLFVKRSNRPDKKNSNLIHTIEPTSYHGYLLSLFSLYFHTV